MTPNRLAALAALFLLFAPNKLARADYLAKNGMGLGESCFKAFLEENPRSTARRKDLESAFDDLNLAAVDSMKACNARYPELSVYLDNGYHRLIEGRVECLDSPKFVAANGQPIANAVRRAHGKGEDPDLLLSHSIDQDCQFLGGELRDHYSKTLGELLKPYSIHFDCEKAGLSPYRTAEKIKTAIENYAAALDPKRTCP